MSTPEEILAQLQQMQHVLQSNLRELANKVDSIEQQRVSQIELELVRIAEGVEKLRNDTATDIKVTNDGVTALRKIFGSGSGNSGKDDAKINYSASNGMRPREAWSGRYDKKKGFREYQSEMVNCLYPLHTEAENLMKEAVAMKQDVVLAVEYMTNWTGEVSTQIDRAIYSQLHMTTSGEAREVVKAAGQGNGLQAWHDLNHTYELRSDADKRRSIEALSEPK